jgi:hypothetical protein
MARRRYPHPRLTFDDRIDDLRHGSPIEQPQYYRVRFCDLTPEAANEWDGHERELEDLTFSDVQFWDLTGRWPRPHEEV